MPYLVQLLGEPATAGQTPWRLCAYRHLQNWTQADLARHAGVSRETVSRIEKGLTTSPDLDTCYALADALVVPWSWLWGGVHH